MVEPLLQALPNFDIKNYSVLPVSVSPSRNKQVANHFYPLQTCSDMCGVIVMCMAAATLISNLMKLSAHLRVIITAHKKDKALH